MDPPAPRRAAAARLVAAAKILGRRASFRGSFAPLALGGPGGDPPRMRTALACALLVSMLPACERRQGEGGNAYLASALRAAKERGKFVVLTEATFHPFEYKDEKGDLQGFDIDLAREIGREAGLAVEFRDKKFDEL